MQLRIRRAVTILKSRGRVLSIVRPIGAFIGHAFLGGKLAVFVMIVVFRCILSR